MKYDSMALATPNAGPLMLLLRSNDAPTPCQKSFVERLLRDKETELSALGDEISRLESTLRTLRKKHSDLAVEMHEYSGILSPIRRVPPEIIGEIFLYFAPSIIHPNNFRRESRHTHPTQVWLPWKLGHICHRWRTISLSLSQLWAVLDLAPQWRFRTGDCHSWLVRRRLHNDDGSTELPVLPEFADSVHEPERSFENEQPLPLWDDSELNGYHGSSGYHDRDWESFEIATSLDYIERHLQRSGNHPFSFRLWAYDFAASTLLKALLKHSTLWREIVLIDTYPALLDCLSTVDLQGLRKLAFICSLHPSIPFSRIESPQISRISRWCGWTLILRALLRSLGLSSQNIAKSIVHGWALWTREDWCRIENSQTCVFCAGDYLNSFSSQQILRCYFLISVAPGWNSAVLVTKSFSPSTCQC
ncbi:hypothetical protein B0H12DRAFT_364483 [Mycena haematopus]|nr:hypothetical protein B0H12DRAFT_364483 [Mycena haematopus]